MKDSECHALKTCYLYDRKERAFDSLKMEGDSPSLRHPLLFFIEISFTSSTGFHNPVPYHSSQLWLKSTAKSNCVTIDCNFYPSS